MKPYSNGTLRGISGCRRSTDTAYRRRCLRTDKRRARRAGDPRLRTIDWEHCNLPFDQMSPEARAAYYPETE